VFTKFELPELNRSTVSIPFTVHCHIVQMDISSPTRTPNFNFPSLSIQKLASFGSGRLFSVKPDVRSPHLPHISTSLVEPINHSRLALAETFASLLTGNLCTTDYDPSFLGNGVRVKTFDFSRSKIPRRIRASCTLTFFLVMTIIIVWCPWA
jgi:hypothetical protein